MRFPLGRERGPGHLGLLCASRSPDDTSGTNLSPSHQCQDLFLLSDLPEVAAFFTSFFTTFPTATVGNEVGDDQRRKKKNRLKTEP